MGLAMPIDVVHILALAGDIPMILASLDRDA
jgi:hypothetical protein